ncbi:glycerol-3-phosphate acyltransferase [Psychrobacillus sp. FJAT-51614]|uniref:Glycerol-3-phosphate acyltransferase n=1 Tax=Psychrobacillus mangrovi TaxID=3117745 RepID=A0ABU8F1Y9_9BACI
MYWIISYIIGTFLTAWWVGKWKKTDLRTIRSGNLGARNAGAVLGKSAFLITFLGDAFKGILVIYIGIYYHFSMVTIAIGGLFVILGHLFPFWLKFKGGKGIATFIGVALFYHTLLFGIFVVLFILLLIILRSATLSMIIAFFTYACICLVNPAFQDGWPLSLAIIIILIRHRFDMIESWNKRWWKKTA